VLTQSQDNEEIIERVAALDIGKAELMCCVRVPDEEHPGKRMQEVQAYSTMTRSLLGMSDHLHCLGVTRVVMEATSDYWKPVFYLLESTGFEVWLVNARDVKHLPGRPKTDKHNADASKQSRPLLGVPIVLGMKPSGTGQWSGDVYNASDGKTYSGSFTLSGPNTADLKGCVLSFLCKTQTWTRAH
jgi:hypothetical protein